MYSIDLRLRVISVAVIVALLMALAPMTATPVYAATITVNTDADSEIANDDLCTLREALNNANNNTDATSGDCVAGFGVDTINFADDYTITLTGGVLEIGEEVIIEGTGSGSTIIQASTCNPITTPGGCIPAIDRILNVFTALDLSGVTLRYGNCESGGACLYVDAGGAIYTYVGSGVELEFDDVTFDSNFGSDDGGALMGITFDDGASLTISNSTFTNNSTGAVDADGGAAHIETWGTVSITNSSFTGNEASDSQSDGGALYISEVETSVTITGNTFTTNDAGVFGGGLLLGDASNVTMADNSFTGNTAFRGGGAFIGNSSGLSLTRSTFNDNEASAYGGGLEIYAGGGGTHSYTVSNSTFSGNSVTNGRGGAIAASVWSNSTALSLSISNSTIVENEANGSSGSGLAGGVYSSTNSYTPTEAEISFQNSIVMYNTATDTLVGNNCIGSYLSEFDAGAYNLFEEGELVCGLDVTDVTSAAALSQIMEPLADNGGPTETRALYLGSPALNTGSDILCESEDQRGTDRTLFPPCDIGAYEYDFSALDFTLEVTTSVPANGDSASNVTTIDVTFNKDVLEGGGADAGDNPANYLLVEAGVNTTFDTTSCLAGAQPDDTTISVDSASYDDLTDTATLGVNGAVPLPLGEYRLLVCGTTSIYDLIGFELNDGGADTVIDFSVVDPATGGSGGTAASADELPEVGFAQGVVTTLPAQPADKAYAATGFALSIPQLGLTTNVVGVPLVAGNWDVSWLGQSAGYLYGSAYPTWAGNTVIAAHVWDANNQPGPFYGIDDLQYGDQFSIFTDGQEYVYEVRANKQVRPWDMRVFAHSDYDTITLLTCEGYTASGEYAYRRAVTAVLVAIR